MKKQILVFIVMCQFFGGFAQKASIHLDFSAVNGASYQQLDSIKIENLNQGGDTMLYWNDTILSLVYPVSGIQEGSDMEEGIGIIYPQHPESPMVLRVFNLKGLRSEIKVFDLLGQIHCQAETEPTPGVYQFKLFPGDQAIYLITLRSGALVHSIKMVNPSPKHGNRCFLSSSIVEPFFQHKVRLQPLNNFAYNPGDSLKFTGYAFSQQQIILDNPTTNHSYVFQFNNQPCQGINSFTYGGQLYHTIQIGTQCWMKENLNIGTMLNGYHYPSNNSIIEKYCYDNDPNKCAEYGGLYSWDEMMQYATTPGIQGICPTDWHIPSDIENSTLLTYLGGFSVAGGKLKESGILHWTAPNPGATNVSGFTALGAGYGISDGTFANLKNYAFFWSSTEFTTLAYYYTLYYYYVDAYQNSTSKLFRFSVRCLKD